MTDVVINFFEAKKRLRTEETALKAPPIQKTLALADEFRRQLDAGGVNQAALARRYGLTRARITQVLNLLKLHPTILGFLRALPPSRHARLYAERRVRPLLQLERSNQLEHATRLLFGFALPRRNRA